MNKPSTDFKSIYDEAKVLKTRVYRAGYILRVEEIDDTTLTVAYTYDGLYIGDSKIAYFLCVKKGIVPELANKKHRVCSIGYCKKERKWYGWSHRAIHGFAVGSKVKMGDCAFKASCREEFIEDYKGFWHHERRVDEKFIETKTTIRMTYSGYKLDDGAINHNVCILSPRRIPKKFKGRGVWTAKNLVDARQMAVDFASGVS